MKKVNPPFYNQTYINVGRGPAVILLHGLFGNLGMWEKTVKALKTNHNVIVPRLPIFDLPIQHTNIRYLANVLHEFIDWNGLTDVTLVGHAIGGQVALIYTYIHPTNVDKLVLCGSTGLFENSPFDGTTPSAINDYEFVEEKVNEAFFQPHGAPRYFVDDIYATVQSIPKRLTIGSLVRSSRQSSVALLLGRLDHPTLLLWGLEDRIAPPETALLFHDLLQNSEVRFIEQCGHVPMVEKPDEFNGHVLSFLT
jgi:2-hydroxy-6-oxonona-2,4-dienedioate hydrolase